MKTLLINIVCAYAIFFLFAIFFADHMIFFPRRAGYKDDSNFLKLSTADGATIFAVYLPNKNAKYTVLASHGNAEDIGNMLPFFKEMQQHGFAVFAYDYHGYGLSSGKPSEHNTYIDADAAYDYLTRVLKVAPENIISYGHSLGAAVAIDLAVRKKVAAVITEGGFTSAFRVVTRIPLLPFDKFNNIKKIKQLMCPLLVIHGTADRVIPFWHGKKIYEIAKVKKLFYPVKNAGHNDVAIIAGEEYWQVLKDFQNEIGDENAR